MTDWKKHFSKSQQIGCWFSQSLKKTYPAASKRQPQLYEKGWILLPDKNPITGLPQYMNVFTGESVSDLSKLTGYIDPNAATSSSDAPAPSPPAASSQSKVSSPVPSVDSTTSQSLGKRPRPSATFSSSSTSNPVPITSNNHHHNNNNNNNHNNKDQEDDQRRAAEHYNRLQRNREDAKNSSAAKMRSRHNWIKNVLIGRTISQVKAKNISVLELACGKGGDFFKIKNACPTGSTLNYVGVDIAQVSLEEVVKRISERNNRPSKQGASETNVRLSCVTLGTDDMIGSKSTHLSSWNKQQGWHHGPAFSSSDQFDVVTMQFALHYMFQSKNRLKQFFESWSNQLKEGGRFIATTMDSDVILDHVFQNPLENPVNIKDEKLRPCCSMLFDTNIHSTLLNQIGWNALIDLRYEITLTEYDESTGEPYNYVEAPEWIVVMATLVDAAWRHGRLFLELNESCNFHKYFQLHSNDPKYNELLKKMKVFGDPSSSSSSGNKKSKTNSGSNGKNNNSFTKIEWDLTRLYRTLSFRKGGGRRVAIIVPFRDEHKEQHRSSHLAQFMSYMLGYMSRSLVPFHIYIIEQSHNDGRKFNRGKLLNIGYNIAKKEGKCDAFIFHDVDLLPNEKLMKHYQCQNELLETTPNHIARVWSRYNANPNYIGGVTSFSKSSFEKLNGFPNNFWGWGGEDDELQNRMKKKKLNFVYPKEGTLTDLENMTLTEKLTLLKSQNTDNGGNNNWTCMVKQELLKEHSKTWKTNGLRGVNGTETILYDTRNDSIHPSTFATKINVHLTKNNDKWDTVTSWKELKK